MGRFHSIVGFSYDNRNIFVSKIDEKSYAKRTLTLGQYCNLLIFLPKWKREKFRWVKMNKNKINIYFKIYKKN